MRFLFFDVLQIREQKMVGVIKHFDEHIRDNLPVYIPNDASYASVSVPLRRQYSRSRERVVSPDAGGEHRQRWAEIEPLTQRRISAEKMNSRI